MLKNTVVNALQSRLHSGDLPKRLSFLREHPLAEYYDTLIDTLYIRTRPHKGNSGFIFAELICAIGRAVRRTLRLPADTQLAAPAGAFLLWTFEDLGILEVTLARGRSGHNVYVVKLIDDKPLQALWDAVAKRKSLLMPRFAPFGDWHEFMRMGHKLVQTGSSDVAKYMTPENCPIAYSVVNRAQRIPWRIKSDVYLVAEWALRNKTEVFNTIWLSKSKESQTSKLRETKTILMLARRAKGRLFYHRYYLDFRGRRYPGSAYLHEQGGDLARGLIERGEGKQVTKAGFQWLLITLATQWGGVTPSGIKSDKLSVSDRLEWALENEMTFLEYATYPRDCRGWMKAAEPWQFLGSCMELLRIRMLQAGDEEDFSMISHHEAYIDGSNNGLQHLSALTKDEITAPHVNLIPQKTPGDIYAYIGNYVWQHIADEYAEYDDDERARCQWVIARLQEMRDAYLAADKAERAELYPVQREFRKEHRELIKRAAVPYWLQFDKKGDRRKLVKRNVMTLPYGSTPYGMGEQNIEDAPGHGIEKLRDMENVWGAYLGRVVYEECANRLVRPMSLLSILAAAGKQAELRGDFLHWVVPLTNFLVVQHYVEGEVKKLWVQYGPPIGERLSTGKYVNTFQISTAFTERPVMSKGKQSSGASPNFVHSLDAAHMMLVIEACEFDVSSIHDSYGCLLADMPVLFKTVREQFVELYKADPIRMTFGLLRADLRDVPVGTLDIELIKESEYAFL